MQNHNALCSSGVYMAPMLTTTIDMLGTPVLMSDRQRALISDDLRGVTSGLPESTFRTCAATDVAVINAFLVAAGFGEIQLFDTGAGSAYAASVLDLAVAWVNPGSRVSMTLRDGTGVPAVQMRRGTFGCCGHTLFLPTTTPDVEVWITESDSVEAGLERMQDDCTGLDLTSSYQAAEFPMVVYESSVDLRWLLGMGFADGSVLAQAAAKLRLTLDHLGAHVKAAAAMGRTRGPEPKVFRVLGPCTIAVAVAGRVAVAVHCFREHFIA